MTDIKYTREQLEAINHNGGALLISAAAGSGKTKVLVERLMRKIKDPEGPDIDRFLVITFTRAAATELKSRILDELLKLLALEPSNRRLRRQMTLVHKAHINTIHSFCSEILREYAHLLDMRPDFRMMDESEAHIMQTQVLEELLEKRYENITDAFKLLIDTMSAGRDDSALCQIILDSYGKLQSHPYPQKWLRSRINEKINDIDLSETIYGKLLLDRAKKTVEFWISKFEGIVSEFRSDAKVRAAYDESYRATLGMMYSLSEALSVGWDEAFEHINVEFPNLKSLRNYSGELDIERIKNMRDRCKKAVKKLQAVFDDKSEALLEDMRAVKPASDELFSIVADFSRCYAEKKKNRGVCDYNDLEHLCLNLLCDGLTSLPTEIASGISGRFDEILVDEYQDVNRVQDMIFTAVSKNGKNLTMVGDVKQSIYRFRLADPSIFLEKYNTFTDYPKEDEPRRILLSQNFRSRKEVLDYVNYLFAGIMSSELGEMEYGEKERLREGGSFESLDFEPCEVIILDAKNDGDSGRLIEKEAEYTAAYIKKLLTSGMVIKDGEDVRPLKPGDIAILLRSRKNREELFVAALSALGINASVQNPVSIFEKPEIRILMSLLQIIDNPKQDVPLIAVLRSPLYAFSANELAEIRECNKSSDFFTALYEFSEGSEKCKKFLNELHLYRERAADLPTDRLLRFIYDTTNLPSIASAIEPGAASRLFMLLEYACEFEKNGYKGLFAFVRQLKELSELDDSPLKIPPISTGEDVQVTSIHNSKGLEYPVVILADLVKLFNREDSKKPLLIHQELGAGPKRLELKRRIEYPTVPRLAIAAKINGEMLSEEMRVLYVAMTRAKEKLVMLISLKDADAELLKLSENVSYPVEPQVLEDSKSVADWILYAALSNPEWNIIRDEPSGEITLQESGEPVKSEPSQELVDEIYSKVSYRYGHLQVSELPSKITATELKGGYRALEATEEAKQYISVPEGFIFRRPSFTYERGLTNAEKGTALHMVMQYIDFSNCGDIDGIRYEIQRLKELKLISEKQADSVEAKRVKSFFTSSLGLQVLNADALYREFKFSLLISAKELINSEVDDKILFQGVVDLCVDNSDGLTIIDFKSDYVDAATQQARAEYYRGQLEAYAIAMSKIYGKPVKDKVIYFFSTGECCYL